jgi:hypothetical protein
MDSADLCTEAVVHQNNLKSFLLSQLFPQQTVVQSEHFLDTTIVLADGRLSLNRIFLGLMFPGLGHLVDFDGRSEVVLCLPDFMKSDLHQLVKRILIPSQVFQEVNAQVKQHEYKAVEAAGGKVFLRKPRVRTGGVEEVNVSKLELKKSADIEKCRPTSCHSEAVKTEDGYPVDEDSRENIDQKTLVISNNKANYVPATVEEASTCDTLSDKEVNSGQHRCGKEAKRRSHYLCTDCTASFPSRRALSEHRLEQHGKSAMAEKKRFACRFCPEVYNRQDYLKVLLLKIY